MLINALQNVHSMRQFFFHNTVLRARNFTITFFQHVFLKAVISKEICLLDNIHRLSNTACIDTFW